MMTYVAASGETELELEEAVNTILHESNNEVRFLGGVVVSENDGLYVQAMLVYKKNVEDTEPQIEAPKSAEAIANEDDIPTLKFGF